MVVVFSWGHFDMHCLGQSFSVWKVLFATSGRKSQWGELLDGNGKAGNRVVGGMTWQTEASLREKLGFYPQVMWRL